MTWERNQGWHLARAREPSRLPEQLPQLTIDPGGSSRRCRQSLSKERRRFWVGFLALFRGFSQIFLAFTVRHPPHRTGGSPRARRHEPRLTTGPSSATPAPQLNQPSPCRSKHNRGIGGRPGRGSGLQPGDEVVFSGNLLRNGEQVGRIGVVCTFVSVANADRVEAQCPTTSILPGGTDHHPRHDRQPVAELHAADHRWFR
jgi:hypothetical protein